MIDLLYLEDFGPGNLSTAENALAVLAKLSVERTDSWLMTSRE